MTRTARAPFFLVVLLALAATPAASALYLWEVISLTNHVYLYGTVHAGRAEWLPLPREVEEAYGASGVLVVEADITDARAMARTARTMTYALPDTLRNHVPAADYTRLLKLLPRYSLPEEQVAQMKPFMAVSLLVFSEWGRVGYLPQYGIDGYLLNKARVEKKPVVEIEGVEVQAKLVDSLTDKENVTIFQGTLDALESGLTNDQIAGMVGAWQQGNPQLMLEIARRYNERVAGARDFEEKFVWSRHASMLEKIEGYLNNSKERHFIAVGALHLAGPRGLVEMLRKRGYIVRQR